MSVACGEDAVSAESAMRSLGASMMAPTSEADLIYTVKDGSAKYGAGAYVTSYTGSSRDLVVPATLGGRAVVSMVLQTTSHYWGWDSPYSHFLDVSACTKLRNLECRGKNLSELDLSGCSKLRNLDCSCSWRHRAWGRRRRHQESLARQGQPVQLSRQHPQDYAKRPDSVETAWR